jgi:phosphotriesterase-related protein
MLKTVYLLLILLAILSGCKTTVNKIITMTGPVNGSQMGKTLHHEHLLVDFIGADSTGYHRWNRDSVAAKVLPYLMEIKAKGYKTLVDCTPEFLGRDPLLLKMLSEKSGIHLITNTGLYTALNGKFLPRYAFEETPEQLAERWSGEAENGIEKTGIFPGFIKIAVERKPLEDIQRKIVAAAALTHLKTGLIIMSHTGLAVPAFQQLEILRSYGVAPSAFIWTHAHNEKDSTKQIEAAKMGAWIAFDNFSEKNLDRFVRFAKLMKEKGLLHKLMFSHDGGWYKPGEPGGGSFRGFTGIDDLLIPALKENGFTQDDLDQLFISNLAEAFSVRVRKTS